MTTRNEKAGFEELPHTADWALKVWAPNLAGLFEEAARGMYALSGVETDDRALVSRKLEAAAADREGLLVDFLGELLYFAESERIAFRHFFIKINGMELEAELEGGPIKAWTKEIKAVTYHNLAVEETDKGLMVELVFDV